MGRYNSRGNQREGLVLATSFSFFNSLAEIMRFISTAVPILLVIFSVGGTCRPIDTRPDSGSDIETDSKPPEPSVDSSTSSPKDAFASTVKSSLASIKQAMHHKQQPPNMASVVATQKAAQALKSKLVARCQLTPTERTEASRKAVACGLDKITSTEGTSIGYKAWLQCLQSDKNGRSYTFISRKEGNSIGGFCAYNGQAWANVAPVDDTKPTSFFQWVKGLFRLEGSGYWKPKSYEQQTMLKSLREKGAKCITPMMLFATGIWGVVERTFWTAKAVAMVPVYAAVIAEQHKLMPGVVSALMSWFR